MAWNYEQLKSLVADLTLPAMLVDLELFDANSRRLEEVAVANGKKLRVASKSLRVPDLLLRLKQKLPSCDRVMCFSVAEARLLAERGFEDLLVAYPAVQESELALAAELTRGGTQLTLMLDSVEHVRRFSNWQKSQSAPVALRVCIDVDMSYRPAGVHMGVQRSPIRTLDQFRAVVDALRGCASLQLVGVMGYEAHIAGLGDKTPFAPLLNPIKRGLKKRFVSDVRQRRREIHEHLTGRGIELEFFNGGGTGSIDTTSQEPWITEVTAGSGFLQSHLFDYYANNRNQPAFCFALRVTRIPQSGVVTCQSGGFIASGESGPDKAPLPFLPDGLAAFSTEGFGEVQTPLKLPGALSLAIGDPIFFRPAKAGEIAERFLSYLLISGGEIVGEARTYRGLGQAFF